MSTELLSCLNVIKLLETRHFDDLKIVSACSYLLTEVVSAEGKLSAGDESIRNPTAKKTKLDVLAGIESDMAPHLVRVKAHNRKRGLSSRVKRRCSACPSGFCLCGGGDGSVTEKTRPSSPFQSASSQQTYKYMTGSMIIVDEQSTTPVSSTMRLNKISTTSQAPTLSEITHLNDIPNATVLTTMTTRSGESSSLNDDLISKATIADPGTSESVLSPSTSLVTKRETSLFPVSWISTALPDSQTSTVTMSIPTTSKFYSVNSSPTALFRNKSTEDTETNDHASSFTDSLEIDPIIHDNSFPTTNSSTVASIVEGSVSFQTPAGPNNANFSTSAGFSTTPFTVNPDAPTTISSSTLVSLMHDNSQGIGPSSYKPNNDIDLLPGFFESSSNVAVLSIIAAVSVIFSGFVIIYIYVTHKNRNSFVGTK